MIRSRVRAARCAVLAAVGLGILGVVPASAGAPTYVIYVDGPMGGTIEATGGAPPLPDGACGLRVTNANALAWAWYEGGVFAMTPMDIPGNGWFPPDNQLVWLIEFTGPFAEGCNSPYVFHTPATPGSEPPEGAIALVVQFLDDDKVEFLDFDFDVYEPPEPPEPDPDVDDPVSICEAIPEFCEMPDTFVQAPCYNWHWKEPCDSGEESGRLFFGIGRIVEPTALGLSALSGTARDVPQLRAALARTAQAIRFGPIVNATLERWHAATRGRLRSAAAEKAVSDAFVAVGLAARDLQRCHDVLRDALRVTDGTSSTAVNTSLLAIGEHARALCGAAAATFTEASLATTRFGLALHSER